MTQPYDEDPELAAIEAKTVKADSILDKMTPKPKAFARWVVLGYAWDDAIAIDASLIGYCMSEPSSQDQKLLEAAVGVARLVRSKN
ncbi:hypothetical protein [Polaromonas naphthalenivorans]|uniref:Uncharacterized protein n=1 Tax=Polaromonas naphthalenivorans (strain CJ2) TaxID=365044 RepID=A1VUA4_POLNA|nr:hypothetical protein [Polaromonas naphthalenivorans]ABM39232.1 hypothetical protein Pnap_3936 [Polaromonas naphthalenivorans CJ2]